MAKKVKGKQKDEKPATAPGTKPVPPEPEPIPIPAPVSTFTGQGYYQDEHDEYPTHEPINGGHGGGDNGSYNGESWGNNGNDHHEGHPHHTWENQLADFQVEWTEDDKRHQPPEMQNKRALTTITEISSPLESVQRHSLAPSAAYSADNWVQDDRQPMAWGSPDDYAQPEHQSRTLTATPGDRSRKGSPPPHPPVSIHAAAMAAHHAQNQKVSSASEAARKLEESRIYTKSPIPTYHSDQHSHHELPPISIPMSPDPPPKKPISTASAYAREHSYSHRRRSSAPSPQSAQTPTSATSSQWNGPKAFAQTNTARKPAPIPPDPSWIHTGGNAWSNKARAKYSDLPPKSVDPWFYQPPPAAPAVPPPPVHQQHQHQKPKMSSMYSHDAWSQQFRPQNMHPQPHHVGAQHRKHHSYAAPSAPSFTAQSFHGQNPAQHQHPTKGQNQSWEAWGKNPGHADGEDDDDYTTEDDDDYPDDGWGQHAGSKIAQQGQQRGRGNPSEEWDQAAWGGGGRSMKGGHPHHHQQQPNQAGEWGQQDWNSMKGSDTWGHGAKGDAWGQNGSVKGDAWGQTGGKGGDAWGQTGGKGDAWGQPGPGGKGDAWGQPGPGGKGDVWGQTGAKGATWGQTGSVKADAWGQNTPKSDAGWGQSNGKQDAWGGAGDTRGSYMKRGDNPGGKSDEWGGKSDTWGQKAGSGWGEVQGEWSPGPAQTKDTWGGDNGHPNGHASAENVNKPNITAQQRSQILNALVLQAQVAAGKTGGPVNPQKLQQIQQQIMMIRQQEMQQQQQQQPQPHQQQQQTLKGKHKTTWEAEDWNGLDELSNEFDPNRKVHFSPKNSEIWGGSPRSIPSKTLTQAQHGMRTTLINDPSSVKFLESQGAAMQFVTNAFFSNARFAKERLYWRFSPDKDPRVAQMLAWVQKMSFNIGTYGLQKFIATRERGALFINVAFRMPQFPNEPAFDWLPFPILQGTMDKILQESVAFCNPLNQVVVFVFLPSESGQSVAIWRRKIAVPEKSKLKYQAEANAILKQLPQETDYVVMVDELTKKQPAGQIQAQGKHLRKAASSGKVKASTPGAQEKKKRKWWKLFLG